MIEERVLDYVRKNGKWYFVGVDIGGTYERAASESELSKILKYTRNKKINQLLNEE